MYRSTALSRSWQINGLMANGYIFSILLTGFCFYDILWQYLRQPRSDANLRRYGFTGFGSWCYSSQVTWIALTFWLVIGFVTQRAVAHFCFSMAGMVARALFCSVFVWMRSPVPHREPSERPQLGLESLEVWRACLRRLVAAKYCCCLIGMAGNSVMSIVICFLKKTNEKNFKYHTRYLFWPSRSSSISLFIHPYNFHSLI